MTGPLVALLFAQLQPLPPQLVALDSEEGRKLLVESQHNKDFFALSSHFLTQRSTAFCGVASSVMALNALDLKAPEAKELGWRYFTEDNVFTDAANKVVTAEQVKKGGMIVDQVRALLEANGGEVTATLASTSSLEHFRKSASENLARDGDYVIVDFLRAGLGQDTGAHWSPLAAYHAGSDRFLILDVARFRYPPYWARAEDLFNAMNTTDPDSQLSRGWVEVKKQASAAAREPAPPVKGKLGRMIAMAGGGTFLLGALVGAVITRWRMKKKAALKSAAA